MSERRDRPDMNCPACGEKMLDDRDGLTGAPYFCANGHRARLMYFKEDDDTGSLKHGETTETP